jgi:predicted permease
MSMVMDFRYAFRNLARSPGFTAVALLTLAVGIGATTAIFCAVDAVLIRSLSYPEGDRLVFLWVDATKRDMPRTEWTSSADAADWSTQLTSVASLYAFRGWGPTLTGAGDPAQVGAAEVSHRFLETLQVPPLLGRGFSAEEDVPNGPPVVVVSHGFWQRHLGGDPTAVGRTVTLDGKSWTVIGVMPPGFAAPLLPNRDVWKPLQLGSAQRGGFYLRVVARLAPDVAVRDVQAELNAVQARLSAAYPVTNADLGGYVQPVRDVLAGPVRAQLLVLMGATAFVLLIACANVANMLLARATARGRELAVRAALGAGRARLARQLLIESAALASLGVVFGLAVARGLIAWLSAQLPETATDGAPLALDLRVLGFALGASASAAVLVGLMPALTAARRDLTSGLREADRASAGGRGGQRMRATLVIGNFALALALTVGAGLFLKSLALLSAEDPGFRTERLLTLSLSLPESGYPEADKQRAFLSALGERLTAQSGIEAVGLTSTLPFGGSNTDTSFRIEPRDGGAPIQARTWISRVTPGYLEALGVPLKSGRTIDASDGSGTRNAIVVNEAFARDYFLGADPIGRRLAAGPVDDPVWFEVVGVVGDVRFFGLDQPQTPSAYLSLLQRPTREFFVTLRAASAPLALLPVVRREVAALDANLPLNDIAPMTALVARSLSTPRLVATLTSAFATLAVFLAALGVYGTVAYAVTVRTREFGVRMALGAERVDVLAHVLRGGLRLAGVGLALGLIIAAALGRLLQGILYTVNPFDAGVLGGVGILLLAVAAGATLLPAWRAARVAPMEALRYE